MRRWCIRRCLRNTKRNTNRNKGQKKTRVLCLLVAGTRAHKDAGRLGRTDCSLAHAVARPKEPQTTVQERGLAAHVCAHSLGTSTGADL